MTSPKNVMSWSCGLWTLLEDSWMAAKGGKVLRFASVKAT